MEYAFTSYKQKLCSFDNDSPVWILGLQYPNPKEKECVQQILDDFSSRLWISYRKEFVPISPTNNYTSDAGWGCMMRTGQMLLAQAFVNYHLGRGWRLSKALNQSPPKIYFDIINMFLDRPDSPYSIHKIAQIGTMFNKKIGEWFGPTTIAQVLQKLVSLNTAEIDPFVLYVSDQSCIYIDEVKKLCLSDKVPKDEKNKNNEKKIEWRPLVIMMPLRLGIEKLNLVYKEPILKVFQLPHTLGIIGGKPKMSLYFVGCQGEDLIYLDPHTVQTASSIAETYHCANPQKVSVSEIDPSLAVGFYCKDKNDFEDFCKRVKKQSKSLKHPIIQIHESRPKISSSSQKFIDEDVDFDLVVV